MTSEYVCLIKDLSLQLATKAPNVFNNAALNYQAQLLDQLLTHCDHKFEDIKFGTFKDQTAVNEAGVCVICGKKA